MEGLALVIAAAIVFLVFRAVRIVPQQMAYVIERMGKYDRTLSAGLHFIFPIVDRVRYKHNLRELVLDIPEQVCITRDNVQVNMDGVVFMRVMDPAKASYGVSNYTFGVVQLAQTTLRSEIGKLDLDRTFEERETINSAIVFNLDKATDAWGVKVLRYELKSITPPRDVIEAMEKQMRAEREKRAKILESEAERDSKINRAEGEKQDVIKASEASKQRQINEADGQAAAILSVAQASADGIKLVAQALGSPGGREAANLKVAEEYIQQFGHLAKETNTMIIPSNVADLAGMVASLTTVLDRSRTTSGH